MKKYILSLLLLLLSMHCASAQSTIGVFSCPANQFINGFTLGQQPTCSGGGTGTVTSITIAAGNAIIVSGTCTITTSGTCTVAADIANNANVWAGTTNKLLDAHIAQTAIAAQIVSISTATFTPNFINGINFDITLIHASCPCTIASPLNVFAGISGYLTVNQSASGSDLVTTWGSVWKFPGGIKPTLTTDVNAVDTLPFYCRTTSFCEITFVGNFK